MKIVINASPIIFLSKINRLSLLEDLFDEVIVPNAVLDEIQAYGHSKTITKLSSIEYKTLTINNQTAVTSLLGRLHIGEVEVIIGAIESGIQNVILDDRYARNKAMQLGLTVSGTLGILALAKRQGMLQSIEEDIVNLKKAGMYLSDNIIEKLIKSE